jgi:hypothetical protein
MRMTLFAAAAVLVAGLSTAAPARADEHPAAEVRARIEAKLRSDGFQRWGEIERSDDGSAWKVDDARNQDGRKYELRLSANDLHEIRRHQDD